jgi:hypothetical protein
LAERGKQAAGNLQAAEPTGPDLLKRQRSASLTPSVFSGRAFWIAAVTPNFAQFARW